MKLVRREGIGWILDGWMTVDTRTDFIEGVRELVWIREKLGNVEKYVVLSVYRYGKHIPETSVRILVKQWRRGL